MTCTPSFTFMRGADFAIPLFAAGATAEDAARVTFQLAPLPLGSLTLPAGTAAAATFAIAFRAAVGVPGDADYVAEGFDATLPGAATLALTAGRYQADGVHVAGAVITAIPRAHITIIEGASR